MEFGISDWRTYEQGIRKEWLLTNGIGGYSSSTLILSNARRYHGLLVASLMPPGERHLILSKIDESVEIDGHTINMSSFSAGDFVMKGFHYLQKATFNPLPCFTFSLDGILVEKKICLVHGENTVVVLYHITNGRNKPANFRLTPLVNFRDHHHNSHRYHMQFKQKCLELGALESGTGITPYGLDRTISIMCRGGSYTPFTDGWFEGMRYHIEEERGLEAFEDHYIPGSFDICIEAGCEKLVSVVCTMERGREYPDVISLIKQEEDRISDLSKAAGLEGDEFASKLAKAADNFIVYRRSTGAKTIIAGYPWFSDWGRDAMIALSGLTLVTGRFADAKEILGTFSKYVRYGLVPNMFPEGNDDPLYNSVDAALWYFEAIGKYLRYSGDLNFVKEKLYPSMKAIIDSFGKGTINKIGIDTDGLVSAGDPGMQLTWMDAKVGSWVVTPRHGKAVEINALWYNALKLMEEFAPGFGDDPAGYSEAASRVKEAFLNSFWNEDDNCLYDVITEGSSDRSIRPNQILAVSLLYPVLVGDKARMVVDKVWKELYTPLGLRTLSDRSPAFRGIYSGNQYERDGAYHQGTVWTWPLGHFVTAFVRVYGKQGEYGRLVSSFIDPFRDHLQDACIGSISEIFDGNAPFSPKGCFAQAWSVAEILRCYIEDVL